MARNKYPEETVNRILDVAQNLFVKKGYDETSVQDIINGLGGLSKGAIYHHFKSKESILIAVCEKFEGVATQEMTEIVQDKTLNGWEKLRKMFAFSLKDPEHLETMAASPNLLENPRLLAMSMASIVEDMVPNYIEPVIRQGIEDGSIHTEYPRELAEVIIFMGNVWLNPQVYPMTEEQMDAKIKFYNQLMGQMGVPTIGQELEQRMKRLCTLTQRNIRQ